MRASPGRRLPAIGWLYSILTIFALNQAAINMVRPMVAYRALDLGMGAASLGLLSASFSITPLLVALRMGRQMDRRGELIFVAGGTAALVAATLGLAVVDSAGLAVLIYALFALLGLGEIMTGVAVQAMIARYAGEGSYDRSYAAFSFFASIGQMAGPALAALLAGDGTPTEITRTILAGAIAGALIIPILLVVRLPSTERVSPAAAASAAGATGSAAGATGSAAGATGSAAVPPGSGAGAVASAAGPETPGEPSLLEILRTPGILRATLVGATVLSSIDIVVIYLPALGEERLWSVSLVGTLLALRAGSSLAVRLVLGSLAGRVARHRLLLVSMAVSAAALLVLPFVHAVPMVALAMIAAGAGLGVGQPLSVAWVASAAPPHARATALSIRIMGNGVGRIALPVVAGLMAAAAGAGGVLGVTGAVLAVSGATVLGGRGNRPAPPTEPPSPISAR